MSATYERGTVAVATVRGVPNMRVMRTAGDGSAKWFSAHLVDDFRYHDDSRHVTDVRPLVVLDLVPAIVSAEMAVSTLRAAARAARNDASERLVSWIADQIEAQTKPPKLEVYEHLTTGVGDVAYALCGKVWPPNPADSVTVIGRCPECLRLAESGWTA